MIAAQVAFVPGHPLYIDRRWGNDFRLDFSCVDEASIATGIERLAHALQLETPPSALSPP